LPKPAPKIQRWIDLLAALLRRHYPATFEELIRDVPAYAGNQSHDARRRMFERDKDELRGFGVPIETIKSPEGETLGYRLQAGHFYLPYLIVRSQGGSKPRKQDPYGYRSLPVLTFEPEELAAVADAAARVRQLGDPTLAEHTESAMRKLACDLPLDAAGHEDARLIPPRAKADPNLLVTLDRALGDRKRVTFRYHTMSSDSVGRRTVEPFGIFFLNQYWYLAARAGGEETVKNYRLNRIDEVEVNRKNPGTSDYEIPRAFNLREHARSRQAWELGAGDAIAATVAFRARTGAAAAAFRLGEVIEGQPQHRRFRVRRSDAFARWLLSFAGDVLPVAPQDLVDEYYGLVRATLSHHASGGAGLT
jgi:proteasome accessory factor B